MVNKSNQVVCDMTKIILNDSKTLYPGYCEIRDGMLYRYDSNDPMNQLAKIKPWILHNKVEYKVIVHSEPCTDEKLQGKHFMSKIAMQKYLTTNK